MSKYHRSYTHTFRKNIKLLKKHHGLLSRAQQKIEEILQDPYHYKPLRNEFKNYCRIHLGSFVLIFEVREEEKTVVFHALKHHDEAYE